MCKIYFEHWKYLKYLKVWPLSNLPKIIYQSFTSSARPQLFGSEEVTVEDESALVLRCDIRANPPVSSVSWTLNGSAVALLAGGFTVTNDGYTTQLSASSAKIGSHEGTYQCTAHSPIYGEHSRRFHVTLTGQFTQQEQFCWSLSLV